MRILFTSLRNTSHFLPLVPFIEGCRRRGHEVAVAAAPDLADRVTKMGVDFFALGHPGDEGLRPIWTRLRGASEEDGKRIAIGELFAGACAGAALPGLAETVERFNPSILVRESQEYAAIVAAEKVGIPHVRVAITASRNEPELLPIAAPFVDAHRHGLGLPEDPSGDRLRREIVFTLFPASLEPPIEGLSPVRRFRAPRDPPLPLPEWWSTRGGDFVYATLGTVAGTMDDMRSAYRVVLDAVKDLPIRVLLTIGAALPMEILGVVPSNVHVERFVPQDRVLPHAAAMVCHGGAGTVLGGLAAGIPMLVVPMFADQPNNAERVAVLGAGLSIPRTAATAESLKNGLCRVLEESAFHDAARRLAAEIAELPLVDEAAAEMERVVSHGAVHR